MVKKEKRKQFKACGKRKCSIARVILTPGEGGILINKKDYKEYFKRSTLQMLVSQPFAVTGTASKFDITANVLGGGIASQAGAVRHGIARALLTMNSDLRKPLKTNALLTRDSREKERRKYGHRKARKSPQFSKR
ncbi:30S ribosomal protein S9 [bacterium]|nr:30S ribosomal protein S9 [bacterium]